MSAHALFIICFVCWPITSLIRIERPWLWKWQRKNQIFNFWVSWWQQLSLTKGKRSLAMNHSSQFFMAVWISKHMYHLFKIVFHLFVSFLKALCFFCPLFCAFFLQISAEFSRIVSKDLVESFLDELDALVPSLIPFCKAAGESGRRICLSGIMSCLLKEVCLCINAHWD